jgi:hypothetical protein
MANTYRTVNLSAGAGIDDKKIKVSIDDKQHEFIEQKLLPASPRVSITVQDPGLIEKLLVDVDETQINHDNLLNFDVNEHRPLDDGSITTTSLWSSTKIQTELNLKVDKVPSSDNAVTRFDGTSGDLQDSGVLIDDSDNMTGVNDLTVDGNLRVLGAITGIESVETYVTDANITINKGGTKATAETQRSGLTIEMSDSNDVIFGFDPNVNSMMVLGELGTESEVITADHVQTLTNKTISFDPSGSDLTSTTVSDALKELDNDKANTDLNNLEANPSGAYTFYSDISFDQNGTVFIRGNTFDTGNPSNDMVIFSGSTDGADTGFFQAISGNVFGTNAANTGSTWYGSGQIVDPSNSGNSGYAALSSGAVQSGTSGDVYIFSGYAFNGGNRGRVEIDTPLLEMINGDFSMRDGNINMQSHRVVNLEDPIDGQDAVPKSFLESYVASELSTASQDIRTYSDVQDLQLKNEITSEGDVFEGESQLSESQSGTSVSGLSFNNNIVRSFSALVSVEIDADSDLFEEFEVHGINKGSSWEISYSSTGDDSLVTLSIDNLGQVVYNSSSYANFVSGSIRYRAITTSIM